MENVLGYIGMLLEVFAAFLILPLLIAVIYGDSTLLFFVSMAISLFAGILLDKRFSRGELNLSEGITLTALSFLVLGLVASIPYFSLFEGPVSTVFLNSLFESVSGITTTGLSVIPDVESVPKSVLFWRAETQWLGGMGIIIVFLSILGRLRISSLSLYGAQGYTEKIEPTIANTTRRIIKIYASYSLLGIVLLCLTGLPLYEAICTAFAAISTGGFTVVDQFYESSWTLAVVSMLMLLGAINFFIHDKLFKRRFVEVLKNIEVRSLFLMIGICSVISFAMTHELKMSVFEIISAITATGFTITPISQTHLPQLVIMLIMILMFVGSSSGSTAGGIKQMRFVTALKSIPWTIKKITYPKSAVIPFKIHGSAVDDSLVRLTGTFIATYMLFLICGATILVFLGYTPIESIFEVTSAQGTVGLSMIDLSVAPAMAKIVLMISMLLGRLEIFPLLILINNLFKRS